MASGANTPTNYYIDSQAVKNACEDDFKKIDKACKPEADQSDKNKSPSLKKILGAKRAAALDKVLSKAKSKYSANDDNGWMDHCDGLWVKPSSADVAADFNAELQSLSDDLAKNIDEMLAPLIDQLSQELKDAALEAAKDKAVKSGARAGGRWLVGLGGTAAGGIGGVVTEIVATGVNVIDFVGTGWNMGALALESRSAINEMRAILDNAKTAQQELADLAKNAAGQTPTDLMGNAMGVLSRLNSCTRARRCLMVPYGKTDTASSLGGNGCCPGQTGHHVVPEEAVESCENYNHAGAPTVCVEGTNNANGTHGKVHGDLYGKIKKYKEGNWFSGPRDSISYGKIRDLGIESVQSIFPESKCDTKCLRAQLDAYYKDKCKKPMKPAAGVPGKGDGGNSQGQTRD